MQRTRSDLTLQYEANSRMKVTVTTVAMVTTPPPPLTLDPDRGSGEEVGTDEGKGETGSFEEPVALASVEVPRRRIS